MDDVIVDPGEKMTMNGSHGRSWKNAGGTAGGTGSFFAGLAMAAAGGYLLTNEITVTTGYWTIWGHNAFALTLVPFLVGIVMLFFNGRSLGGWLLMLSGLIVILAGIIANLNIYFRPTTLFDTLLMFVLLFGGIRLVAKSLRPQRMRPSL